MVLLRHKAIPFLGGTYKPCMLEGKPCMVEGKPCMLEGKPCMLEGKPCMVEGRIFHGQRLPDALCLAAFFVLRKGLMQF